MAHSPSNFRFQSRTGTAATEFAILLPLLILLGLTAVDLGRFASVAIALDNAAHVGAEQGSTNRYTASSHSSWEAAVESSARADLSDVNVDWISDLVVETTVSATNPATQLAWVEVAVACDFHTLIAWPLLPQEIPIRRQVTSQQYR